MPPRASSFDPYRKFKFKIKFNGTPVAAMMKCSALTVSVASTDFRTGDQDSYVQKLPGQTSFEAVTLEQGVTNDKTFEEWATAMSNFVGNKGTDAEKTPDEFRRDVDIEVYNLNNEPVKSYRLSQCWVSKYTAVPDLDASSSEVMIQSLELQTEGIQVLK